MGKRDVDVDTERELYENGDVSLRFERWLHDQWERSRLEARDDTSDLTLGYVTKDVRALCFSYSVDTHTLPRLVLELVMTPHMCPCLNIVPHII